MSFQNFLSRLGPLTHWSFPGFHSKRLYLKPPKLPKLISTVDLLAASSARGTAPYGNSGLEPEMLDIEFEWRHSHWTPQPHRLQYTGERGKWLQPRTRGFQLSPVFIYRSLRADELGMFSLPVGCHTALGESRLPPGKSTFGCTLSIKPLKGAIRGCGFRTNPTGQE